MEGDGSPEVVELAQVVRDELAGGDPIVADSLEHVDGAGAVAGLGRADGEPLIGHGDGGPELEAFCRRIGHQGLREVALADRGRVDGGGGNRDTNA